MRSRSAAANVLPDALVVLGVCGLPASLPSGRGGFARAWRRTLDSDLAHQRPADEHACHIDAANRQAFDHLIVRDAAFVCTWLFAPERLVGNLLDQARIRRRRNSNTSLSFKQPPLDTAWGRRLQDADVGSTRSSARADAVQKELQVQLVVVPEGTWRELVTDQ